MTPPEHSRDSYKSRKYEQEQQSESKSYGQSSPYWDSYDFKDNYGYNDADKTFRGYGYDYPLERSGYGGCSGGYQPGYRAAFMDPTFAVGIFVVGAFATYIMYNAISTAGIGRDLSDHILFGLEEFEEKVDKIADGKISGDDWISKIYNQFSFFNDVDNQLTETDLDGIEPPILDETWGLGVRNSSKVNENLIIANTTVDESVKLERSKRDATDEDDDEDIVSDPEEKCRVDMWRCLSRVIEGGLHYIDNPEGIYSFAKKTMFKVAFHGGVSNVWSGLMTIPEARQIKKCMNSHSDCVSYEILRREAQTTIDPTDPNYEMYEKMKKTTPEDKSEKKKERLIIVPEFVESMDEGDGSEQYDDDYNNNEV